MKFDCRLLGPLVWLNGGGGCVLVEFQSYKEGTGADPQRGIDPPNAWVGQGEDCILLLEGYQEDDLTVGQVGQGQLCGVSSRVCREPWGSTKPQLPLGQAISEELIAAVYQLEASCTGLFVKSPFHAGKGFTSSPQLQWFNLTHFTVSKCVQHCRAVRIFSLLPWEAILRRPQEQWAISDDKNNIMYIFYKVYIYVNHITMIIYLK